MERDGPKVYVFLYSEGTLRRPEYKTSHFGRLWKPRPRVNQGLNGVVKWKVKDNRRWGAVALELKELEQKEVLARICINSFVHDSFYEFSNKRT